MPEMRWSAPRCLLLAALGGLLVGVLTSFGQTFLPPELHALANSAGSWSAAAFLLALPNREVRLGALLGAVALGAMLAGYELATIARGFGVSRSVLVFWALAAVVVGPVLGVGAAWVRGDDSRRIALGVAPLGGILIGEAIYGLTLVADTTFGPYWVVQAIVGLGCVGWVGVRTRSLPTTLACATVTAVVATAFVVAYSGNLLALVSGS